MEELQNMMSILNNLCPVLCPLTLPKGAELDVDMLVSTEEQRETLQDMMERKMSAKSQCSICKSKDKDLDITPLPIYKVNVEDRVVSLEGIDVSCWDLIRNHFHWVDQH